MGDKVRISVRTDDVTLALDVHLKKIFGPASGAKVAKDGVGEGGALVVLDFPNWMLPETQEAVLELVRKTFEARIFPKTPEA